MNNIKLYIITRKDLQPGAQAAQSVHVAIKFGLAYPLLTREWSDASNNIALLVVPDEPALQRILDAALGLGDQVRAAFFREPDFGDAMTAIALHGDYAHRLVSSLPLALKLTPRAVTAPASPG